MVHVVGSVRHPGVYELDPGSRVIDAVDAAGGTLPDAILSAVNMARPVGDGEQILVPDEDDPAAVAAAAGGGGTGGGAGAAALAAGGAGGQQAVDINSADAAALETLPGVGPSTAAKIIADRESNGPFASVDDLTRVSGIGPKKLEQIKPMACVR
jgi:competence protein ComEA